MTYTLTYLNAAADFNNLLHSIVTYERARLTDILEGTIRKQDYVRADRTAMAAYLDDITTTNQTLLMHFEAFRGDDAENPYIELTPVAIQASLSGLAMARAVASSEADLALWWSQNYDLDADTMAEQRILSSDLRAFDFFLYGKACEVNETTLVQTPNIIN